MPPKASDPPPTTLPDLQSSFSAYIKPASEILKIRQILTLYLLSNISATPDLPNATCHHIDLLSPPPNLKPHLIPPEVTNLRKDYLRALQSHLRAREEYENLARRNERLLAPNSSNGTAGETTLRSMASNRGHSHQPSHSSFTRTLQSKRLSLTSFTPPPPTFEGPDTPFLSTHMQILHFRHRLSQLHALHHNLDLLEGTRSSHLQILDGELSAGNNGNGIGKGLGKELEYNVSDMAYLKTERGRMDERIQGLVYELQKAVAGAQAGVVIAKTQLEEARRTTRSGASGVSEKQKARALRKTRDELIGWIERELAMAGQGVQEQDASPRKQAFPPAPPPTEPSIAAAAALLQEKLTTIKQNYATYTNRRRTLLTTISQTTPTLPTLPTTLTNPTTLSSQPPNEQPPTLPTPLTTLTSALLPTTTSLTQTHTLATFLTTLLQSLTRETHFALSRLQHESHLLPAHPMPAPKPKHKAPRPTSWSQRGGISARQQAKLFDHHHHQASRSQSGIGPIGGPGGGGALAESPQLGPGGGDGIREQCEAWAYAARISGAELDKWAQSNIEKAKADVEGARKDVEILAEMVGVTLDDMDKDKDGDEGGDKDGGEGDIWLESVDMGAKGKKRRNKKTGVWGRLKGDVGAGSS
ncbi:MAG: hypothetical protein M1834_002834 [Cirrosporium novae-zelandiae]|nr:MAG: hypothetical protein M1834_002834 [Cirrosporium novae-zelandiae]